MKVGIVRFPGSNCDADVYRAVTEGLGESAVYLWHKSNDLEAPMSSCSRAGSPTGTT